MKALPPRKAWRETFSRGSPSTEASGYRDSRSCQDCHSPPLEEGEADRLVGALPKPLLKLWIEHAIGS